MRRFLARSGVPFSIAVQVSAIIGLSILSFSPVSWAQADKDAAFVSLRRHQEAGIDLRIVRVAEGYLFDASVADSIEDLSVNLSSGLVDLTDGAEFGEAVTSIVYVFAGGGEGAQCKMKWALDTILGQSPVPNPAFSDQPNELCPELGFAGTYDDWQDYIDSGDGYRRVLAILVSEPGEELVFEDSDPLIWDRLALTYRDQDDKAALARRLADFVLPRQTGFLSFVPFPAGNDGAPVTITFYSNDVEILAVSTAPPLHEWIAQLNFEDLDFEALSREAKVALGGGVATVVAAGLIFFLHRRRRKLLRETVGPVPTKAVKVGYGKAFDYSLGEGPDQAVALVEAYGDGRRRIVRLDPSERIEVDGMNIGQSAWVGDGASVRIARKKIVLS